MDCSIPFPSRPFSGYDVPALDARSQNARSFERCSVALCLLIFFATLSAAAFYNQQPVPHTVFDHAAAALEGGRYTEAERLLRDAAHQYPGEPNILDLLGVTLDAQERYAEAEQYYQEGLKASPNNAALWNNLGNHYYAQGKFTSARSAYQHVVGIDSHHANANLHLAEMSVDNQKGDPALYYLRNLSADQQTSPVAQILLIRACLLRGDQAAAQQIVTRLETLAPPDVALMSSLGMVFVHSKRYAEAEKAFSLALRTDPVNFDLLFDVGLAAMRDGHLDRAEGVFNSALKQRPADVDCLFNLARVLDQEGRGTEGVALLNQAHRLSPGRADILLFLAHATEKAGLYRGTVEALDDYLKLEPGDGVGRRERAFALACEGNLDAATPDLEAYVRSHPEDPRGFYELGVATIRSDAPRARAALNRALQMDPNYAAARYANAVADFQGGRYADALGALKLALEQEPRNFLALDLEGQSYLRSGRTEEALRALAQASEVAPQDPAVLRDYGQALMRSKRPEEAAVIAARLKALSPQKTRSNAGGGILEFIDMSPAEQQARYLRGLEERIRMHPSDASLKLRLAREWLAEGKTAAALVTLKGVRAGATDAKAIYECGKTALAADQYEVAQDYLKSALRASPRSEDIRLDLAVAKFHVAGPAAALAELDHTPAGRRQGDWFLLRAQILDAQGKTADAVESLNQGLRAAPTRADLCRQSALFLIKHQQVRQAVDLLRQASLAFPDAAELLLTAAVAFGLDDQSEEALRRLGQIEGRWPEWSLPYAIHGTILVKQSKYEEAKRTLESAISLGSDEAAVYYNLALIALHGEPADLEGARQAIDQALCYGGTDPYVHSMAGKIALLRKDYPAAFNDFNAALKIWPDMVEAHQNLSTLYRAMGEKDKALAEAGEVARIKKQGGTASEAPGFYASDLLFSVRPPQQD